MNVPPPAVSPLAQSSEFSGSPTMDAVAGYENINSSTGSSLPPPAMNQPSAPPEVRGEISKLAALTDEEAREALIDFVSNQCCYGKKAALNLTIKDLKMSSAFHYTLKTFCEARTSYWTNEPYTGQEVDGPGNGPAPAAWDISVLPHEMFKNSSVQIEVPHTASIKPCHKCLAIGRIQCHHCKGFGTKNCHHCNGTGHVTLFDECHTCLYCNGAGRMSCNECHGDGKVLCKICNGMANLKCYIKLEVKWINHIGDYIVERTSLPDELIRNVTGEIAFQETFPRVWPINHFPDQEVNEASKQLVNEHTRNYPSERILQQNHVVRIIPVAEVFYKWQEKNSKFFVYGFEQNVYAPDYPQKMCCGCSIL